MEAIYQAVCVPDEGEQYVMREGTKKACLDAAVAFGRKSGEWFAMQEHNPQRLRVGTEYGPNGATITISAKRPHAQGGGVT